ncbi:hypothetical protein MTO96_008215 [Rhipicephalus appendiculatus]
MVFLVIKTNGNYTTCSGTILTQRNILTAAHCIKQNDTYPTRILAYYNSTEKFDGEFLRVDRMKVHPDFNETSFVNDIALLRVERSFTFTTRTRPICISLEPIDIFHKHVRVAGWGRLKQFGPSQRLLYYTSLRVMSDEVCMRKFASNGYNTTLQFCAHEYTTDACDGDSGGPAIARADNRRFLQVGIVSYGAGCADKEVPGVYTRLDALVPWILDNILYGTWLILNGFSGICLTSSECNLHGGVTNGRCAQGYGVCCQVSRTCGEIITRNNSYFVDPASVGGSLTPGPNGVLCSVTVYKVDPAVCQLRLNMERFDIIGPDVSHTSGVCSHDAFHVSAPSGCVQYHEDPTGAISSFNYGSDSTQAGSGSGRLERGYPNFSRYSICFRLAAGACSLRLAKDGPFGVYADPAPGNVLDPGRPVTNRCEEFRFRSPLQADFLMLGVQPFCGDDFPDSLEMVDTGAMIITFVANGTHRPEYAGFRLRYQMVPCVRRRHNLDIDTATRMPVQALFFQAPTTSVPHVSASTASGGLTSASSGGFQQNFFPSLPEPEVYTEAGYFPEPDGPRPGGQIVLYHKGVYKDLAMKIVRNLVSVGRK